MFRCILLLFSLSVLSAQETAVVPDSASAQQDSVLAVMPAQMMEFMLETIRIEAVIEKPNVMLIPKKASTDVGDLPFDRRSFEHELNASPEEFIDYNKQLDAGKRITPLKKTLAKDN